MNYSSKNTASPWGGYTLWLGNNFGVGFSQLETARYHFSNCIKTALEMWKRGKIASSLIVLQVVFIIIFTLFVHYHGGTNAINDEMPYSGLRKGVKAFDDYYPMFKDVHAMVIVGFGFLMTFLQMYSYAGLGLNLLICSLSFQWSLIVQNVWDVHNGRIYIDILSVLEADIATIAVVISSGVLLGRVSPLQLMVMCLMEITLFACNQRLALKIYKISDIGNSVLVHTFGAYFGLAVSFAQNRRRSEDDNVENPPAQSNMFAMIGTLFLWVYWPSYNSAMAEGHQRQRAVINTYLSLVTCTVVSFGLSSLSRQNNKFNIVHIQNATIAGGVAIGTSANMLIYPYRAMIIGLAAACISILGFQFLSPILSKRWKINDSCGVHNVHGLPGIVGGIVGAIMALLASKDEYDEYGISIYEIFPAAAPKEDTDAFYELTSRFLDVKPGDERTFPNQAVYQMTALVTTLVIAIIGGLTSGFLLRLRIWDPPSTLKTYQDGDLMETDGNI